PIIIIDRVWSITPSRVPVIGVPIIPPAVNENDVAAVVPIPPPGRLPDRLIVHKNLILRTLPILSAGNLVVLVEVHRLVLVDDVLLVVRLQVEVLLLEFSLLRIQTRTFPLFGAALMKGLQFVRLGAV